MSWGVWMNKQKARDARVSKNGILLRARGFVKKIEGNPRTEGEFDRVCTVCFQRLLCSTVRVLPFRPPRFQRQQQRSHPEITSHEMTDKSSPSIKPTAYLALNVETTGRFQGKDAMFAIGWAVARAGDAFAETLLIGNLCLQLDSDQAGSPSHETNWPMLWERNQWEMSCWETFWSKNQTILDLLQDPTRVNLFQTEQKMMEELNKVLEMLEGRYNLVIVTDTTTFDPVWLDMALRKHGFVGLDHPRQGNGWRPGFEKDSYVMGVLGLTPETPKDTKNRVKKDLLEPKYKLQVEHDHHPGNDALLILVEVLAAIEVVMEGNIAAMLQRDPLHRY